MERRSAWELVSLKAVRSVSNPLLDPSQAMHSTTSVTEGKATLAPVSFGPCMG